MPRQGSRNAGLLTLRLGRPVFNPGSFTQHVHLSRPYL
uniref:Uncharacterized protein n=1 Tax=Anguilla anguilla TaxID=7936 RepID=A0A0E9S9L7_ANGAN